MDVDVGGPSAAALPLPPFPSNIDNLFLRGRFKPTTFQFTRAPLLPDAAAAPGSVVALPRGIYIRNGPNLPFAPRSKFHWFEGDGMLHAVHIETEDEGLAASSSLSKQSAARLHYTNRFVDSVHHRTNLAYGKVHGTCYYYSIFLELNSVSSLISMLSCNLWQSVVKNVFGVKDPQNPWRIGNVANTALAHHRGNTYALVESSKPMKVAIPSLETLGEESFGEKLSHPFTAHPKVCSTTGDMLFFGYYFIDTALPVCSISQIDGKTGEKGPSIDIGITRPQMIHDFAVTHRSCIVLDLPMTFDKKNVTKGKPLFNFDVEGSSRIGIVERRAITDRSMVAADATGGDLAAASSFSDHRMPFRRVPVSWTPIQTCYVFHYAGAFERSDAAGRVVTVIAVRHPTIDVDFAGMTQRLAKEHRHELSGVLYKWTLTFDAPAGDGERGDNTQPARLVEQPIGGPAAASFASEFPVINPNLTGLAFRFVYTSSSPLSGTPSPSGLMPFEATCIVKWDIHEDKVAAVQRFNDACAVDEFYFVPRTFRAAPVATVAPASILSGDEEDDGWLCGYVTPLAPENAPSEFVVLHGKSLDVAFRCTLPQQIPHGFHGLFIPQRSPSH